MSAYRFPELLNVSRTGAKLRGDGLPPVGTTALFRAGPLHILCRVVWSANGLCGVKFDEPVQAGVLKTVQLDGAIALDMLTPDEQMAKDEWVMGSAR